VELEADLEPSTVIDAYRRGLFPMGISELAGLIGWWSPNPRGILPLDSLRVTRSMRQSAKRYDIRVDTCFTRVMQGCAAPSREGSWITDEINEAYTRLHELGYQLAQGFHFDRPLPAEEIESRLLGTRVAA